MVMVETAAKEDKVATEEMEEKDKKWLILLAAEE